MKAAALAALLMLSTCETRKPATPTGLDVGLGSGPPQAGIISVWTTTTPNHRLVTCVSWRSYDVGGLSCDWDHTTEQRP